MMIAPYASRSISGIASLEIVLIGGPLFAGSANWSAWQLQRGSPK